MFTRWPDLAVLELLVAVADHGSLGAAARTVDMAQPNASRTVAQLERSMGLELLERHPRGSRLTAQGLLVVDWARNVLHAGREFNAAAASLRSSAPATLRLAASMTVAEYLMPAWLAELRRRDGRVRVDFQVCNSADVIERLQRGDIQLGFVERPQLPHGLHRQVVARDELVAVVAGDHPWARRRAHVTVDELAATPLVVRETGSGTREALEDVLHGHHVVEPAAVLNSNAAVMVSVASGAGPAVLSRLAVHPALQSGRLTRIPVQGLDVQRSLSAVWSGPARLMGPAADLVSIAGYTSSS